MSEVDMSNRPTGTVTFLFTDIEDSTERWQRDSQAMAAALAAHDELIRSAVSRHDGQVFKHTGDGLCAVFASAPEAVNAAVEAQAGLELPVRMGLHTGEAEPQNGDYFGPTLNRAARVMDAAHGGQVLVSSATAGLLQRADMVDLGEYQLRGLDTPEHLFQVGFGEFPAPRTPRRVLGNLPVELSSFVGRSDEVKTLAEELTSHRLVTLIGVGGTGKTRLAIETSFTVSEVFPDGCWLVELGRVTVDESVPFAFVTGLGLTAPSDGDVLDHVVSRTRHKRCLVIVDNCEHVLAAAANAVERIVAACPNVVVLATSREPLMMRGERLVPVPPLLPDDAETLFLQRARDESPDLVVDDDQRRAVTELCQRLDGLPLALELAASRVRAFTPVELVANLEERFRLLVGGRRSRLERHQTMRGTLDWSYDLCGDVERDVFDRLSVFPAAFDLAAARAVASGDGVDELDVVDVVPHLVDRSLLQHSTAPDGTTRYRMLETMRAYGREHLQHRGLGDAVRRRHAEYMASTIAALTLRSVGPDEEQVSRRLSEYLPDAFVALDWFIDHFDWENGLRVTIGGQYVSERESDEMIARLHDAAKVAAADEEVLDELRRSDPRVRISEPLQDARARGWRSIRARLPIPTDRFVVAPHIDFNEGGLLAEDVDEFVASLDHWLSAPVLTRFYAGWYAVRALVHSGHVDRAEQLLGDFTPFIDGLDSRRTCQLLAELHGSIAMARADWKGAVAWYSEAAEAAEHGLHTWFDLAVTWHLLTARCLCPEPVEITAADLRDPWQCYRNEHLDVLQFHGAVSTAVALHRLGHDDLARRFAAWYDANDTVDRLFDSRLEAAGLAHARAGSDEDLDTLVDEVLALADRLDGIEPSPPD